MGSAPALFAVLDSCLTPCPSGGCLPVTVYIILPSVEKSQYGKLHILTAVDLFNLYIDGSILFCYNMDDGEEGLFCPAPKDMK